MTMCKTNGSNGVHQKNDSGNKSKNKSNNELYRVKLPSKFLKVCILGVGLTALLLGKQVKKVLRQMQLANIPPEQPECKISIPVVAESCEKESNTQKSLPAPVIPEGKEIPEAIYTSKNFNIAASVRTMNPLIQSNPKKSRKANVGVEEYVQEHVVPSVEDDEEHLPAGQHLLVDIKNVDGNFLNDEGRLAQAMIDVVSESQLTLLSYHCHALEPMGVSCAGVLLESHVAFHTWPEEGVITLDLFTCGGNSLLPVLPLLVRLFGVPSEPENPGDEVEEPTYIWGHKLRGFREKINPYSADLGKDVLGIMDFDVKTEIADVETPYQTIHVYDVIEPRFKSIQSYTKSLVNDASYEAQNKELFAPDRLVYLDGYRQSSKLGDEAYHESLVHPGMFAHPNPRNVAIIGGGEGATLREVLKHNTVDNVVMIEIDGDMVNASRKYLSSWNDCSDIIGSTACCFDHPRAKVLIKDALKFFIKEQTPEKEQFDVIIVDALDPEDQVSFAEALYSNYVFLDALYEDLSDDGIIILQVGQTTEAYAPSDELTKFKNRAGFIELLQKVGMKSFFPYEDFHANFQAPWTYLVACKSSNCRANWYANEADIELAIHRRIIRTNSGKPPLKYFDGSTMSNYQIPHKSFESTHCRRTPMPIDCEIMKSHPNVDVSFDVLNVVGSAARSRYSPAFTRRFASRLDNSLEYAMNAIHKRDI